MKNQSVIHSPSLLINYIMSVSQNKSEFPFADHPSMIHLEERKSMDEYCRVPITQINEIHIKPKKCTTVS